MDAQNKQKDEETIKILEKCSLLVDSELTDEEIDSFLESYAEDENIGESVQLYHLVGDILRSKDFAASHVTLSKRFNMAQFRERLSQEPFILAPVTLPRKEERQKRRFYLGWPQWAGLAVASVAMLSLFNMSNIFQGNSMPDSAQTGATTALQRTSEPTSLGQKISVINQSAVAALSAVGKTLQGSRSVTPAYYMAAHHQFGYDAISSRNYSQELTVQTAARK
ncbi:MAG: sigma-E factor negative regulatory protein [Saezia sp.]